MRHGYTLAQILECVENSVRDGTLTIDPDHTTITLPTPITPGAGGPEATNDGAIIVSGRTDSATTTTTQEPWQHLGTGSSVGSGDGTKTEESLTHTSELQEGKGNGSETGLTFLVPGLQCRGDTNGTPPDDDRSVDRDLMTNAGPVYGPPDCRKNDHEYSPETKKMMEECAREVRVVVKRIPGEHAQRSGDILSRVLHNTETEADCIRAETSQIMGEEEIQARVENRREELTFTCGRPLNLHAPDITSTPRPQCGSLDSYQLPYQGQSDRRATPEEGQLRRPRPLSKQTRKHDQHDEVLRSDGVHYAEEWNVSLGESFTGETDGGNNGDNNNNQVKRAGATNADGLALDPAGLNQLASNLRESFNAPPQPQQHQHQQTYTSSPKDPAATPLLDEDDPMDNSGLSTGSRKRTRGGKKHRKNPTADTPSEGTTGKQARQSTTDQVSPRGRGRPPGSLNKKYQKERSSERQTRLISTNVGEQREREKQQEWQHQQASAGSAGRGDDQRMDDDGHGGTDAEDTMDEGPSQDGRSNEQTNQRHTGSSGAAAQGENACRTLVPVTQSGSTPWTTDEIAAISEAIGQRCAGGSAEYLATDEPGLLPIDMDYMPSPLNTTTDLNESRVFDMRDLVSNEIDIRRGTEVRTRDVVQFVVLARPRLRGPDDNTATPWRVPDTNDFHDLINRTESYMINKRLPCYKARKWSNLWGKVGLIGLSPKSIQLLNDYRDVVEGLPTDTLTFTLFPREAVENRGSVSVILREQFRSFDVKCVPASLFSLNRGLRGSLRVTHCKVYGKEDKTRSGASKEGWRLLLLQGCPDFMKSLEQYDEDVRFPLGSGYIYIRGGVRKPRAAPSSRNTQGRTSDRNQNTTSTRDPPSRREDNNRSNGDDFPRLNNQDRRGRERESRDGGGAPSWGGRSAGPAGRRGPSSTAWGGQ